MNIVLFEALEHQNTLGLDDYRAKHIKKILKLKEGDSFKAGVIDTSTHCHDHTAGGNGSNSPCRNDRLSRCIDHAAGWDGSTDQHAKDSA